MAKPRKVTKKSVRLVKRGDVIVTAQGDEEVVRGVQVVLQLSNGSNEEHLGTDFVEVLAPEELPDLEGEG